MAAAPLIAAVEAGGTKFVVSMGRRWQDVRDGEQLVVPTGRPEATLTAVFDWLDRRDPGAATAAVGIASFGPLDLAGCRIARTPKPGWTGFDWAAAIARWRPGLAVGFDTDTSGAALAEYRHGAAAGTGISVYITVGTGIGAGIVVGGRPLHGLVHPEVGHMRVPRAATDPWPGGCPFHGDCLEGLASGPAVEARWGRPGRELPPEHPAWALEAEYLAAAVANLVTVVSPERVVLGGGVTGVPGLLDAVRERTRRLLGGYVDRAEITAAIDRYLVEPALAPASGVIGAFELGRDALAARG